MEATNPARPSLEIPEKGFIRSWIRHGPPGQHLLVWSCATVAWIAIVVLVHFAFKATYCEQTKPLLRTALQLYHFRFDREEDRIGLFLENRPIEEVNSGDLPGPLGLGRDPGFRGALTAQKDAVESYQRRLKTRLTAAIDQLRRVNNSYEIPLALMDPTAATARIVIGGRDRVRQLEEMRSAPKLADVSRLEALLLDASILDFDPRVSAPLATPTATAVVERVNARIGMLPLRNEMRGTAGFAPERYQESVRRWVRAIYLDNENGLSNARELAARIDLSARQRLTGQRYTIEQAGEILRGDLPPAAYAQARYALNDLARRNVDSKDFSIEEIRSALSLPCRSDAQSELDGTIILANWRIQASLETVTERETSGCFWLFGCWRWWEISFWTVFGVLVGAVYHLGRFVGGFKNVPLFQPTESLRILSRIAYAPLVAIVFFLLAIATNIISAQTFLADHTVGSLGAAFLIGMYPNRILSLFHDAIARLLTSKETDERQAAPDRPEQSRVDAPKDPVPDFAALKRRVVEYVVAPLRDPN